MSPDRFYRRVSTVSELCSVRQIQKYICWKCCEQSVAVKTDHTEAKHNNFVSKPEFYFPFISEDLSSLYNPLSQPMSTQKYILMLISPKFDLSIIFTFRVFSGELFCFLFTFTFDQPNKQLWIISIWLHNQNAKPCAQSTIPIVHALSKICNRHFNFWE